MNNPFNDTLPKSVLIPETYDGVSIDTEAVRAELSRWAGWYHKETIEKLSPKEQRSEAEAIATKLLDLHHCFQTPLGMPANLRAFVKENMRQLGVEAPDFARLAACVRKAGEQLTPVRRGPRSNDARDSAIRSVFRALKEHSTPPMKIGDAMHLASELVRDSIPGLKCPTDLSELRKIVMGN